MIEENATWAIIIGCLAAVLITLIWGISSYYKSVEIAAINKGLCQVQSAGVQYQMWSTCPLAK